MFKAINRAAASWQRRRRLNQIRREFARCGYPVDHRDDSKIEAALTNGGACHIEEVPLSAKMIYFALRQLSSEDDAKNFSKAKNHTSDTNAGSITLLERTNLF